MTLRHHTGHSRSLFSRPFTLSPVLSHNGTDPVQIIYLGRGILHHHHHVTKTKLKIAAAPLKEAAENKTYVQPLLNGETFPAQSVDSSLVKMLLVEMNVPLVLSSSKQQSKKQDKRETPMSQSLLLWASYGPLRTEVRLVKPDKNVLAHND